MYTCSIRTREDSGLLHEALRTLPSPESGYVKLVANGMTGLDSHNIDEDDITALMEKKIIPFLDISFEYDFQRKIFIPNAQTQKGLHDFLYQKGFPTKDDLKRQNLVSRATVEGTSPYQYTIHLRGYQKEFDFMVLQERFLSPLEQRGYPLTSGEIDLEVFHGDHGGGNHAITRLSLGKKFATLYDDAGSRKEDPILDWFQALKAQYDPKSQPEAHPS